MPKDTDAEELKAYHRLSFQLVLLNGGATAITPCIDGTPLSDLAAAYEARRGYNDPAGGYGGIVPEYMNYGPMDDYFLGRGVSPCRQENGAQYLLGCQCGEVGCWPLMGRIVVLAGRYEWRDLHNPCRDARDYNGLGPFRFEASTYEKTARQLTKKFA
jgi:hypothetical protein